MAQRDYEEVQETTGDKAGTAIFAIIVVLVIVFATWYIYQGEFATPDEDISDVEDLIVYRYNITVDLNETFEIYNAEYSGYPSQLVTNISSYEPTLAYLDYNFTISGGYIHQNWTFRADYAGATKVCFKTVVSAPDPSKPWHYYYYYVGVNVI